MPNVFDVMYEDYFEIKNQNWKSGLSIAEQLYTPQGSQSVIISEGLFKSFKSTMNPDDSLILTFKKGNEVTWIQLRI